MRRLRYQVASSLDGYIAGPNGEFDWIAADPEIDFGALFKQYDTVVMGRRTLGNAEARRRRFDAGTRCGGLFANTPAAGLLEEGVVDTVEPAAIPVLLGGGVPLLPATANRTQ